MEELNNSFTKWCVEAKLATDEASGDHLITGMGYLLNDAAMQKRGDPFDPKQLRYTRLERSTKHELITKVLNFAWFSQTVVEPFVRSSSGHSQLKEEYERVRTNANFLTGERTRLNHVIESTRASLNQLQQKVIKLQDELLEEKNKTIGKLVGSVENTVKEELKSYAAVVQKSCSSSLAPAKLQAAMKKVTAEEERSCNMIVYGLEEAEDENTEDAVLAVIQHTDEKPKLVGCRRLGEKGGEKTRPIRVTFHTREMVRCVLAKSAKLKEVEGYSRVYLSPDRTVEQRQERKRLLGVLSEKRESYPEKRFAIRRGEVTELE